MLDKPVALTIAGLDPSGGAGIIADIRAFLFSNCFPAAVVTSITYQNTTGITGRVHQPLEVVRNQLTPLIEDYPIGCVKTGMLPSIDMVMEVKRAVEDYSLPNLVIDPVLRSGTGTPLVEPEVTRGILSIFPLSTLVTPNIPEAEILTGKKVRNVDEMAEAARLIREMGARAVLIKGGHTTGEAIDLLDDGEEVLTFSCERIEGVSMHGTGCTMASLIAAGLAHKLRLRESIERAKEHLTAAIEFSPQQGKGRIPLDLSYGYNLLSKDLSLFRPTVKRKE
jgi:hydroxymethylpyrimidine/phosphomethylpyrimidine kinase